MALIDSYTHYSTGSIVRTARKRSRWKDDAVILPSASKVFGTYADNASLKFGTSQTTVDYKNDYWVARRLDRQLGLKGLEKFTSRFNYGSNFYSRSVTRELVPEYTVRRNNIVTGDTLDLWRGRVFPHVNARNSCLTTNTTFPVGTGDSGVPDMLVLRGLGSHGIAETLPSVPQISIAQSLGELKEGLPKIIGKGLIRNGPKGSGDEFLNYTFGIRPLIKDLQGYVKTSRNYDEFVHQYNRDNGRLVRRARNLGSTEDVTVTHLGNGFPQPNPGGARHWFSGSQELIERYQTNVWFVASYRVMMPPISEGFWRELHDFTRTYGLVPNADTAWNLFPWTWLLDWVINFDDVITNLSYLGRSGVNLHYAYVMAESKCYKTWTYSGVYNPLYIAGGSNTPVPLNLSYQEKTVTKQRVGASPFGFGVGLDFSFSPSQLAILSALGLSRL
jgi:hypothetical protein